VANCMTNQSLKTELVDFQTLEETAGNEKSSILARNVAALFALTHESISEDQLEIYDSVLIRLADMVETETRAHLSHVLAPLPNAPRATIRRLAYDEIDVAKPVLIESSVLDELDLTYLAEHQSDGHLDALTQRKCLPENVSDVIARRGSPEVLQNLIENVGAELSHKTFTLLIMRTEGHDDLQHLLTDRDDMPRVLIGAMIDIAAESVRRKLVERGEQFQTAQFEEAADLARKRIVRAFGNLDYDFAAASAVVRDLRESGQLSVEALRNFAKKDAFPEVVCAFSVLVGISFEMAVETLSSSDPGHFVVCARARELDEETVKAILSCGPWRIRLTREMRDTVLQRYRRLQQRMAMRIFDAWQSSENAA